MARCSTYTGLPLDTWAAILGISPFEFNQCRYPSSNKTAQCTDSMYQFAWQRDHLSREEVGEAIAAAERMLADELLYWPYPRYFVGEVQPYPRPHQRNLYGYAGTIRGEMKTFQLNWKKVVSGGVMNRTEIGTIDGGDLTRVDLDSDNVKETFTATITDPAIGDIADPYELALYFVAANRHGEDLSEQWRIRPLKITISGNTATFTGHSTLLIDPQPEFSVDPDRLVATNDAIYVTEVECHRVYTDTQSSEDYPYQGTAQWKTDPGCSQNCTFEIAPLCLGEHNNEVGRVYASFGDPCTWPFDWREPDRVEVNYVAGLALENGQIPPVMAQIITYLSVSLLANEKCGCDRSNRILAKWRAPVLRFQDNNGAGASAFAPNSSNFPMTEGGQYAWQRVRRMKQVEVVSL